MNVSLQDAANLGWKLAAALQGGTPRSSWTPTLPTKHLREPGQDMPPRGLLRDGRGLFLQCGGPAHADLVRGWQNRVDVKAAHWVS